MNFELCTHEAISYKIMRSQYNLLQVYMLKVKKIIDISKNLIKKLHKQRVKTNRR